MPEVTVLIPNYNHAPYLNQRIDSVLNQTYQDFEVIILDDCSPDNSREIIEQYRNHPKVSRIVFNEVNGGTTFKQWEKGIKLARGKYIWIAESDDWCEPNLLEVLVNGMHSSDNCVLSYCQSYCVDNDLNIKWLSGHRKLAELIDGKHYVANYLTKKNEVFNASMALFLKDSYYQVSDEYTTFKFCGDWIFWAEIAIQGNVYVSAKILNYFRKHGKDVSGKAFASGRFFYEELKVVELLRRKQYISAGQYKELIIAKYNKYSLVKFKFPPEVVADIDKLISSLDGGKWSVILKREAAKHRLRHWKKKFLDKWLS